jgi:hypothetical protein
MPTLLAVVLAAQATGASPTRVAQTSPLAPQECVAVQVGLPAPGRVHPRRPTFSARSVAEIELTARPPRSIASRHLEFRLFLPDGNLYQKVDASDTTARAPRRRTPLPTARSRHPTARFPVAGTAIPTSSLYGVWSVVPYLDGRQAACGPVRFTIRP